MTALGLTLLGAPGGEAIEGLLNVTKAGAGMVENAGLSEVDKNEAYQDKKTRAEKAKQRKQDRAAKPAKQFTQSNLPGNLHTRPINQNG